VIVSARVETTEVALLVGSDLWKANITACHEHNTLVSAVASARVGRGRLFELLHYFFVVLGVGVLLAMQGVILRVAVLLLTALL
jgi:hypothetical protein